MAQICFPAEAGQSTVGVQRKIKTMQVRYPEYYGKFHCLAGACPDTCCVGWEILVDRESLARYRRVRQADRELGEKLRKFIRRGRIVPVHGKCPFLEASGLCGIMDKLGEDAACRTCRNYPRHREDYGELQEILLLLSCPEAARLVLAEEAARFIVREFPGRPVNLGGIDEPLLKALLQVRGLFWEMGLERDMPFTPRMQRVLALAHDVQRRLDMGNEAEIEDVVRRYREDAGGKRFLERLGRPAGQPAGDGLPRFLLMSDFMESLTELETISRDWPGLLESCRKILYHSADSRAQYQNAREKFFTGQPEAAAWLERIFSYFLYSFFLASLYDRDVYGKARMAVFCTWAVEELMVGSWRRETGGEEPAGLRGAAGEGACRSRGSRASALEKQAGLCHIFARQVENSEENRELLGRILGRKEFRFRRLMNV